MAAIIVTTHSTENSPLLARSLLYSFIFNHYYFFSYSFIIRKNSYQLEKPPEQSTTSINGGTYNNY